MNALTKLFHNIKSLVSKPIFAGYFSFNSRSYGRKDYYYGLVFSCIDSIATAVSSNHFHLYRQLKKNKQEILTHPALDLLSRPNDYQSGVDLIYLISSHIDSAGVAYLYAVPNGNNKISELWALDPMRMRVVSGKGFIDGYVYLNNKGQQIPFDPSEIIPIMRPNPYNQLQGISTIEMARRAIEGDLSAQDFNSAFFNNGANPSGILTTESGLSEEAFDRLKEQWHETYEGKANAHKTLILEGGLKYQQVQISQRDMDFVKQRQFSRDEILSIFRVPKTIVAITDDVNRANAETSDYVFASRVLLPRLELIFEKLNQFYLPLFGDQGLNLEFDNPVPENKDLTLREDQAAVNEWLTINEVRSRRGYEPLSGGDILYLPNNLIPAGQDTQPQSIPAPKVFIHKWSKDQRYIYEKRRYLGKTTEFYQQKLRQGFKTFIKDIKKRDLPADKFSTKSIWQHRAKGVEDLLLQLIPNTDDFKGLMASIVMEYGMGAIETAIEQNHNHYELPAVKPENSIAWLNSRSKNTSADVNETLLNRAREIIARNLENEETSLSAIRSDLIDTLEIEMGWRAERIARTELITAYNQGAFDTYEQSKLVDQVKWITAEDDRVDEECAQNDGKIVDLGDTFPSGVSQPPVHPNCRCDIVPYFGA